MHAWQAMNSLSARRYTCGHCGNFISSSLGFFATEGPKGVTRQIYLCSNCNDPTFFAGAKQVPGFAPGATVAHLPTDIEALYLEARSCIAVGANTASILASRKLLMHIAVTQAAPVGGSFISYVEYLADKGWVPPNGKSWVDHIRKKGNEANHEILLMSESDAQELVQFLEMLLKFIYEFPARVPGPAPAA